jgi:N-acetylglucosamine-6-phosphate deacetylase
MRLRARHYATGELLDLAWDHGRLSALAPAANGPVDLEAGWVAPALFDLQINGCHGHSFNSPHLTTDGVRHVVEHARRHGIGALCPTLVTNSFEALAHGLRTIRAGCEADPALARALPAVHLEGPYISAEDGPRGAHAKQFVRQPSWDEFRRLQDISGGRIRLVTLAPEHEGAARFIDQLVRTNVVVSLGHTAARGEHIRAAIAAGARLSTHLGNGAHAVLPRHDNYIWEQLAADELWASIICDGHHLPATVVRCMVRVKTPARTILTCDASPLAGLPPGRYREWEQDFDILPEGKIIVAGTPFLAGSWAFTDLCLGNAMRFGGVSLADAIDMATARPRELLGLSVPQLEVGAAVDLMLFDWQPGGDVAVRATLTES